MRDFSAELLKTGVVGSPSMAAAIAATQKKREEALGQQLEKLLAASTTSVKHYVALLRQARENERRAKDKLNEVCNAQAYFVETGVPFPYFKTIGEQHRFSDVVQSFCTQTGQAVPDLKDEVWNLPAKYKPNDETLAALKNINV